jgi:type I restriction enzyme S subunit
MVEDVTRDGKIVFPQIDFLTKAGAKLSRPCRKGTLTIVCSGTVGVASFLGVDACIHDGFLALVNISKSVSDNYLYYQFCWLRESFNASATHGGIFTNLTTFGVKELSFPFPPFLEQQAIAEVLTEIDTLLTAQQARLAKQRAIKQGLVQTLLSGEKRLPGFAGKWEELSVKNDCTLNARIGWQGLTTNEYLEEGPYYLVGGTEFRNGRIDWRSCFSVDKFRYVQDTKIQLRVGDILVTKDGTIGKVAYVDKLPKPATLNSGVFVLRPKRSSFLSTFLFYLLRSEIFDHFIEQLTAGSTIAHLYQKDFIHFKFFAPSLDEQRAIAAVLSEADASLSALEAEHTKTQLLKQGMMQNLLTGKLRLV